ncbi:hypothetical protein LUZ63_015694 [Rhynchospora breviuscula]|uniref:F-box domain-containing protein n=1 Tax=Rhynchospora breviuscula TaxID=2022672 RepID=A0A9Q0CCS1_9POAL|nr:hypothetical protein LUZ63_015694 [Rhynchospora breviuscula]
MSEENEEERRDWSELPSELLHLIVQKLPTNVPDFIRFRTVCSTWRSSAPVSDPPHQFPWLLELFKRDDGFYTVIKRQRFYSISSGETLTIPLRNKKPELRNFVNGGVYNGYLPFVDYHECTLSFFNPITRERSSLLPMRYGRNSPWMVWNGTTDSTVVLHQYLLMRDRMQECSFYDPRRNRRVEKWEYHCCYWQGMFFSTYAGQPTDVFNVYSKQLLQTIRSPEIGSIQNSLAYGLRKSYLIVSSGAILRVLWFYDSKKKSVEESVFYIYSLDFDRTDGKSNWVRIYYIGDQILFLGEMNGFSMTARPNSGFREGCIYFIDPSKNKPYMYDLLGGTVERVPCPFDNCTWFLPVFSK